MVMGTPSNVRVGPGWLYIAPIGSTEPTDFSTAWDGAWVPLGYTDEGPEFVIDQTFEDVMVAEELDPIATLQTARSVSINVAAAEITAENLSLALNGGTIDTGAELVTFEPPAVGDYTHVMVGWDATDGLERWVFRKCLQVGSVTIPRRRAPDKALIQLSFRALVPDNAGPGWISFMSPEYALIS